MPQTMLPGVRLFTLEALVAAAVAVLGAGLIRYDGVSNDFLGGFLLMQLANFTFAAGQVGSTSGFNLEFNHSA